MLCSVVVMSTAISRQDRCRDAAVITASALPPISPGTVAIFVVRTNHLHEHRMIVAANFQFRFHPVKRIFGIMIPIIPIHIDTGDSGIPAFIQPQFWVTIFGAQFADFWIVQCLKATVFNDILVIPVHFAGIGREIQMQVPMAHQMTHAGGFPLCHGRDDGAKAHMNDARSDTLIQAIDEA